MIGDTPDDLEARRIANEKVIAEAIAASLAKHFSPPPREAFAMPDTPADKSARPVASLRDHQEMSENGAGQYQALDAKVEAVRGQFHDFKEDVNGKLLSLQDEVRSIGRSITDFIQNQSSKGGDNLVKIGGMILGIVGIAMTIATAFGSMANTQLATNINFTNEKIATSNAVIKDNFASTNSSILGLADAVKDIVRNTVPRSEVDNRIGRNEREIEKRISKDVYDAQIGAINSDLERFKNDVVSRREHEQHWMEFGERLNKLSDRLNEVAKASAGTPAIDTIRQLQDQVQTLTNRFVAVPKFPVLPQPTSP